MDCFEERRKRRRIWPKFKSTGKVSPLKEMLNALILFWKTFAIIIRAAH